MEFLSETNIVPWVGVDIAPIDYSDRAPPDPSILFYMTRFDFGYTHPGDLSSL